MERYYSNRVAARKAAFRRYKEQQWRQPSPNNLYGLDTEIISTVRSKEGFLKLYEARYGVIEARGLMGAAVRDLLGVGATPPAVVEQRCIDLAPALLSPQERYDIVAKLYQKTKRLQIHYITVISHTKEGTLAEVQQLLERMCLKPLEHEWPNGLVNAARWLCDDDAASAKRLVCAIESDQSLLTAKAAKAECARLVEALQSLDCSVFGKHTIEFPYGLVIIQVRKPTLFEKVIHAIG
jgi:hypothetical protein